MVRLYVLPLSEAEKLPEALGERYFPRRMERVRRFFRREDATRCFGAGALLHVFLGVPEEETQLTREGKPFCPGTRPFNLSHSGDVILLATGDEPVGADVEREDERYVAAGRKALTPGEREWMEEEKVARFFRLWTMKESLLKCLGCGFLADPEGISVLPLVKGEEQWEQGIKFYPWTGELAGGYRVSVCAREETEGINIQTISAKEIMENVDM